MKLDKLNKKKYTYGGNISNNREINFKNSFSEKGNLNGKNDDFDNIYQTATPMIADNVVPGLGTVVKTQQGLGNTIVKDNPKSEFNQIVGNSMKYGNPLIGIPKGIIDAKNARKKEDEIYAEAYRQEMLQANNNYNLALNNGFNPSGNIENKMYKNGGNINMLNKNVSGGKLSKLSDDTVEVKGNKHEQGGVMIGNNSEVEGGETIVNKGNSLFVNSDSLINPKTGKTFAETDMFITKQINKLEKDANNEFNKKALNILRMQKEQNMKEQELLKQQQNIDNQPQGINEPQSFSRGGEMLKNLPSYTDNITGALANYSRSKEPVIQKSKLSYLDRNKYDVNNQPLLNNIDASINTANRSIDNAVSDSKVGEALKAQNLATQIRTKNEAINTNEMTNINSRKGIDSFNIGREDANKSIDYENSMAVQMQKDDIRKEYQRNIVNATEKYRMDKLTKDKNQLDSDNNRLSLLSADSKNVEYMVGQLDENDELFKKYPYLLKHKKKVNENNPIPSSTTLPQPTTLRTIPTINNTLPTNNTQLIPDNLNVISSNSFDKNLNLSNKPELDNSYMDKYDNKTSTPILNNPNNIVKKGLSDTDLDNIINIMDVFEKSKGSFNGTGLNISQYTGGKAKNIQELKQLILTNQLPAIKKEIGSDFDKLDTDVIAELLDYKFNSGRSVADLLNYAKKEKSLDEVNSKSTYPVPKDIDKISLEDMLKAKDDLYRTMTDRSTGIKGTLEKPSPAYEKSWKYRIGFFSNRNKNQ